MATRRYIVDPYDSDSSTDSNDEKILLPYIMIKNPETSTISKLFKVIIFSINNFYISLNGTYILCNDRRIYY